MAILFTLLFFAAIAGVFKPYIGKLRRAHFGIAAFVAFILVGISAPTEPNASPSSQVAVAAGDAVVGKADAAEIVKPAEASGKWAYESEVDEMRGATSHYAYLEGSNTIALDFPYGEQRGKLMLRKSPKFGFDILVGVGEGQILCNSFRDSYINVKFDDGPIRRYSCTDASDGTNNLVFVRDTKGFLAQLRKSQRMIVEAEFFHNGIQQMTFDTANLKWEH